MYMNICTYIIFMCINISIWICACPVYIYMYIHSCVSVLCIYICPEGVVFRLLLHESLSAYRRVRVACCLACAFRQSSKRVAVTASSGQYLLLRSVASDKGCVKRNSECRFVFLYIYIKAQCSLSRLPQPYSTHLVVLVAEARAIK